MDNYTKARVIGSDEIVRVKQAEPGGSYFITNDNDIYDIKQLDFSVEEESSREEMTFSNISESMANGEKIRMLSIEKEFWRNLRGSIFMTASTKQGLDEALKVTEYILDKLKEQDIKFNKKFK